MIQRSQTLWLLLSAVAAGLTFKFPFFNGTVLDTVNGLTQAELSATYNIPLIIIAAASAVIALIAIFLYSDRKKQLSLSFTGFLLSIAFVALCVYFRKDFQPGGRITLMAITYLAIPVGFLFAILGIRRDQKIIKQLDRLR